MPSFAEISRQTGAQHTRPSSAYAQTVLGHSPSSPQSPLSAMPAQARARRNMDYDTALAMQAAKEGDDSLLLPYQPTPSINPPRPRTLAAGYDEKTKTLRVRFRDGTAWAYFDVPPNVWRNFKRVKSPGRAINRVLNNYEYAKDDF